MPKFKIEFDLGPMANEVDKFGLKNTIVDMLGLHLDVIDNVTNDDALEGPHKILYTEVDTTVKVGDWGVYHDGN